MTEIQFEKEQKKLLCNIPEEFHSPLRSLAWSYGHSAGLEEVLLYLTNLVSEFEGPIEAFQKRIEKDSEPDRRF